MLIRAALRNGFTYGKLFHQLEEIVSELLRYYLLMENTFVRALMTKVFHVIMSATFGDLCDF